MTIPKVIVNNDVESQIENVGVSIRNSNTTDTIIYKFKLFLCVFMTLICFPIMFCDIYYANNDDKCVHQDIIHMSINMYDYLMVSGIHNAASLFLIIIATLFCVDFQNHNNNACLFVFMKIIEYTNKVFVTAWTIVGSVIFWAYMDTSQCSKTVFDYLFTTLIIKIVFISITNSTGNNKSK